MKKYLLVLGTRPEAIKMAPLYKVLKNYSENYPNRLSVKLCVTAQHRELLDQVLEIFDIKPDYDLDIMSNNQDLFSLSEKILFKLKDVLNEFKPDMVFVHGDTSTSFIASLAAFYNKIKVAHVEAGLRTNNIYSPWPEEVNRQLTSRIALYHFAPTKSSKQNLIKENIPNKNIYVTGNTVIDALLFVKKKIYNDINLQNQINNNLNLNFEIMKSRYLLVTVHRRENFGDNLIKICNGLITIAKNNPDLNIVYPIHSNPNVIKPVTSILQNFKNIHLIAPLDYLSFVLLMDKAFLILTDSGGVQEEAPSLGKPVLVLRENTERPEAVEYGTVKMIGTDSTIITNEVQKLIDNKENYTKMSKSINPYGNGRASSIILKVLIKNEKL